MLTDEWLDGYDKAATKAFFKSTMDLDDKITERLEKDGVTSVQCLREKYKPSWELLWETINKDRSIKEYFGEHSLQRLIKASEVVRYYILIGRKISCPMMTLRRINNIHRGLKILEELHGMDKAAVPQLKNKGFGLIRWLPTFLNNMGKRFSTSKSPRVPLAYVLCENVVPEDPPPPLEPDHGYLVELGSLYQQELIARVPHDCPEYITDNDKVWECVDEGTCNQPQNATVHQFYKKGMGKGHEAYNAIVTQGMGEDKWNSEVKKHEKVLHTTIWKGTGNMKLEQFIAMNRNAYNGLVIAVDHITYQVLEGHTRVTYLLENIQTSDADLAAAKSAVIQDKAPTGKRNDFEKAAVVLQEACPVAKKLSGRRAAAADISDTTADISAATGLKSGRGKTGVHFCWHTKNEYKKLSKPQREELAAWRETPAGQAAKAAWDKAKAQRIEQSEKDKKAKKVKFDEVVGAQVKAQLSAMMGTYTPPSLPAPVPAPPPAPASAPVPVPHATLQAAYQILAQHSQVGAIRAGPPPGPDPWKPLPGILKNAKNTRSGGAPGTGY